MLAHSSSDEEKALQLVKGCLHISLYKPTIVKHTLAHTHKICMYRLLCTHAKCVCVG